ncbi:uncharacterized protein LOC129320042 isoform X2 [Prosopis cineraria]|uniref:uncharacterized protein LOC129320042 isoform X2 n=1 Tax=Prosopis cineraria TaxID=364024 RepID=UPI00240F621F|nr:uncharacterized protein LOC129320042 isoform X2 [Prosopis cineraria]
MVHLIDALWIRNFKFFFPAQKTKVAPASLLSFGMKFLKAFSICDSEIGIRRNRNPDHLSSVSAAPTGFIELQMIHHGDGSCQAACEAVSLDRFDSLPALQVLPFDNGDVSSPSSRYSSCGESDFDNYCSANSVLGTPSVCSTVTVFNDFTESDKSDLENFSLRDIVAITSKDQMLSSIGASSSTPFLLAGIRSGNIQIHQNLKCSSIGLELHGGDNDEAPATSMLVASSFKGTNQLDNDLDQNSIHNGSEMSIGRNKIGIHTKSLETLSGNESDAVGTTENYLLGDADGECSGIVLTVGGEYEYIGRESNLQIDRATDPNILRAQVKDVDNSVSCPKTYFTAEDYRVGLNLLTKEAPKYETSEFDDDGAVEEVTKTEKSDSTSGNAQQAKAPELDNSQVKFDLVFNSKFDLKSINLATQPGNINAASFLDLEAIVPSSNCEMRKTFDNSSASTNLSKRSPVTSKGNRLLEPQFLSL